MAIENGFRIENGVLVSYRGSGGDVVIPEGVTRIGAWAFCECKNLTSVVIPEGVTSIGESAFRQCSSLTSVVIPEGVTSIGESAFYYCNSLRSVAIPEGVTHIGEAAFWGCTSLTSVVIPEGVTHIGKAAFCDCTSLTSVVIPESVTQIGDLAFDGCQMLAGADGLVIIRQCVYGYYGKKNVVHIPKGVTSIGASAFSGCESLTGVVIPEGVTSIGAGAFFECTSLTSVVIPESVTSIGRGAFWRCWSLTSVVIPEGATSIGELAFCECKSLTSVVIPESVTSIREHTFYKCKGLTSVVIPGSVTSIGSAAFAECVSLISAVIPGSVTSIGSAAFSECASLISVVIPESVTGIGAGVFCECKSLTSVVIPENVTSIGESAFYGCSSLTSVVIPKGVISIEKGTFCGCHSLRTVDFAGAMPKFDPEAFLDCPHLTLKPEIYFTKQKLDAGLAVPSENARAMAYVQMYQSGKVWAVAVDAAAKNHAEEITEEIYALLQDSAKVSAKEGNNAAEFMLKWRVKIQPEQIKKLYELLQSKKCTKAVERLESDIEIVDLLERGDKAMEEWLQHPMEQIVRGNWEYTDQIEKLKKYVKKGIKYLGEQEECSPDAVMFVIAAYSNQVPQLRKGIAVENYEHAHFPVHEEPLADQVAAGLDQEELLTLLEDLTYEKQIWDCVVPLGRYADAQRAERLISQMRKWANWGVYNLTGRQNIILARGALMLNDTRPVLLYMDKIGLLGEYAKLRGTDADTLRDTVLSEFGLDAQGEKAYDLGSKTVIARMNPDLTLGLYDAVAGKAIKSIPKKGTDPEKYEAAKKDLADLRKNIKKVIKARSPLLFEAFLSGKNRNVQNWKRAYLTNPVLNQVAQLIVWNQGGRTFTLKGQNAIESNGQAYVLSEEPVGVAHPIMMTEEDLAAWQAYFVGNQLKQPFEQVWEPKYHPDEIAENRYEGCQISVFQFMNQSKHGIEFYDVDYHNDIGFELKDCALWYERTTFHRHEITADETFTLDEFRFGRYTRYVNHIVFMLDKWTVAERILKDDVSVALLLDRFTVAQISEFIRLASEHGCTNVTALLLNYQNEHFGEYDPLAEFTLEE